MAEAFYIILFWALMLLGVLSAFPLRLDSGMRSRCLLIPALALMLYGLYETAMRIAIPLENVPIRIDLLLIWPCIVFVVLAGGVRLGIVLHNIGNPTSNVSNSSLVRRNRNLQLGLLLPCLVLVLIVAYFMV